MFHSRLGRIASLCALGVCIAVIRRFDAGWNKDIPGLNQIPPDYGLGLNTRQCLAAGSNPLAWLCQTSLPPSTTARGGILHG
jgi:hypothetical protein